MRKHLAALAFACFCVVRSADAQTVGAAPADEYFGHLKLSTLGMRNELGRMIFVVVRNRYEGAKTYTLATSLEDAVEDLAVRYPHESWVPGLFIGLERYYVHLRTPDGRHRLEIVAEWVHEHLRDTPMDADAQACAVRVLRKDWRAPYALCEYNDELVVGIAFRDRYGAAHLR